MKTLWKKETHIFLLILNLSEEYPVFKIFLLTTNCVVAHKKTAKVVRPILFPV